MTLEEFEKAVTLLRTVFEETLSMNASIIDEMFKDNNLDDIKEEMKKLGILVLRKRHNDYFVPWHKNLYGENTIDKVRNELIAKTLKEDTEYQELLQKQKIMLERFWQRNIKWIFSLMVRKNCTKCSVCSGML